MVYTTSPIRQVSEGRGHIVEKRQDLGLGEAAAILSLVQNTPQVSS